jgi:hypothetical protein
MICGNVAVCGNCPTGQVCNVATCVNQANCTDSCNSLNYQCGSKTICGANVNCGSCSTGYSCQVNGTCIKLPVCTDTCTSLNYPCGSQTVCGVSTNCGTCSTGYSCNLGQCVADSSLNFIVKSGVGRADIIVSSGAPSSVKLAGKLFQTYIYNITGVRLQISSVPNQSKPYHVYIGQSNYTDSLGITSAGCENGGFKMISGSNYLILLGQDNISVVPGMNDVPGPSDYAEWDAYVNNKWGEEFKWNNDIIEFYPNTYNYMYDIWEADKKGSLNAVYEFLYNQGVRWYSPGWYEYDNLGTIIPQKQDISFGNTNVLVNPDFAMRAFSLYNKGYAELGEYHYDGRAEEEMQWRLSLKTDHWYEFIIATLGGPAHGIRAVISRQTDHPEFYAISDGVRQMNVDYPQPNLCFPYYTSQNRLFEENVKYVKTMFDLYNISTVSVMPNDGMGYISDECKNKATYDRGIEGWFSDYVWEYVNNVAWEIYNDPKYRGKMVTNSAYTPYVLPPLNLSKPIAPNLAVMITKGRSELGDPEANQEFEDLTNLWLNTLASNNYLTGGVETNKLYTYDYYMHNAEYRAERYAPYNL